MRKSVLIVKGIIFLILFYQVFDARAQGFGRSPLRKCWQIESADEHTSPTFIASDNVNGFYAAFSDGSIEFINKYTGQTNWRSNLGGEILNSFAFDETKIYLISRNLPVKNESDRSDNAQTDLNILALGKETGITKWQSSVSLPRTESEHVYLLDDDRQLFLITGSGKIFFLNKETGKITFDKDLNANPISVPDLAGQKIYIGTSDKKITAISTITGEIETEYAFKNLPVEIYIRDETEFFVGDEMGNIVAVNPKTDEIRWQWQTGARVASMTLIDKGLLVSSFDNYVYLFSEKNGKRLWRKRLSGRSVGQPLIKNEIAVFSTLNGNDAVFIELKKGKAINRIFIPEENYFLSNPVELENLLLFQTYRGLVVYGAENDCKQKD